MKLLQALTQTPSVPGREDRIRKVIQDYVTKQKLFDEVTVDSMGSLIGVRKPRPENGKAAKNPLKVMLAAHFPFRTSTRHRFFLSTSTLAL